MEVIGMLGSICFAICGIPAAYQAWREKVCYYSWMFLGLWGAGEVLTAAYVIYLQDWILLFNYGCNFICLLVLIRYNKRRQ